jgi:hypothetical protein
MQVANLVIQILYVYGYIYNHSKIMIKSGALASIDIAVLVLERNNALCLHGPMPIKWILMLSLKWLAILTGPESLIFTVHYNIPFSTQMPRNRAKTHRYPIQTWNRIILYSLWRKVR